MDEEEGAIEETGGGSIGAELRAAREAKGLSIEEMANKSRIPQRHLENLEEEDWANLPAATYTIGFAKTHAEMVDVDPDYAAAQVREAMGGYTPPHQPTTDYYEPSEERRGMPGWIVIAAILAIVAAVLLFGWMNEQRLVADDQAAAEEEMAETAPPPPPEPVEPTGEGPVVLSATDRVWLEVVDGGETLIQREMTAGERFDVPATATAPILKTGRPEALTITVGDDEIVQLGPDSQIVSDVSLLGPDLVERGVTGRGTTSGT